MTLEVFDGSDLEDNLYQGAVDHLHLTFLRGSFIFHIDGLPNLVQGQGRAWPDLQILPNEIPVADVWDVLANILHCHRQREIRALALVLVVH